MSPIVQRIVWAAIVSLFAAAASAEVTLVATYLRQDRPRPPVLSNLDPIPEDLGQAGALLGLEENRTTGQFLGHVYTLDTLAVNAEDDVVAAAQAALAQSPYLILDVAAPTLLQIADLPQAQGAVLINVASSDTALRSNDCRANLLHTLPSDAMRADALMQFLVQKRWTRLAMISGGHDSDRAFGRALRGSAAKFGLSIGAERDWIFDADMRRNAAQEVPLFTQDFGDYDALLVADELDDFGRYIPYNTWVPRPVAGSEGLVPVAWSPVVEQWGAAQLQGRFRDIAGRDMASRDYAAWAAMRVLGEAVTRTGSADAGILRDYILSDAFELAGFKGRPMSFRRWNGQLRQPIPLVTERAVVAQAPLDGFLHQVSELDTLGLDQPESRCTAFD